ncbi:hypothetical protein HMPREF9630_01088 [Peptoanaerobacter stomatis]|uniref:ABC transporter domain-containing protein n=1 Tax=Peptoanaerobacter stomatis TaxID=796937 RepID=V9HJE3_9FIRM|nr:ABC transporter ATP-binding protein [Peptoanaerobacter stomatis]EHL14639.1 hypothetical protein HMPREF9630_01088 [Peptoanaerobacter stomatis]
MKEIFRIENLTKEYIYNKKKRTLAIDNISFTIYNRSTTAIVGESGCGKTTLSLILAGFEEDYNGNVYYDGNNIIKKKKDKDYKKEVQIIFQNPFDCFNPMWNIKDHLIEPVRYHKIVPKNLEIEYIKSIISSCELNDEVLRKRPTQLSGGQLQRLAIARVLSLKPKVIIADEILTALDVSVQSKIIQLLKNLHKTNDFTLIFISHDLNTVRKISDRIIVMKNGAIVEDNDTKSIFTNPKSEYTKTLIDAIPKFDI